MPIENRPDRVVVLRLADDPQFSAELDALAHQNIPQPPAVVIELSAVRYLNSSNLAKLLRLRKQLIEIDGKLALCGMSPLVMSVFHSTGLDKVFLIAVDVDGAVKRARP